METLLIMLQRTAQFLRRRPNLDGSILLRREARHLLRALKAYVEKAEEVELSLSADYAETAALIEGEGREFVTPEFVREFTRTHCTETLSFDRVNKKERTELLRLAARNDKLQALKRHLDPKEQYRELFRRLICLPDDDIEAAVMSMASGDFRGLAAASGLNVPRTETGTLSASKTARNKVLGQILGEKRSNELMDQLESD